MKAKLLLAKGLYAIKDAAPVIFGAVAVVGVVVTAVLAAQAGPKAADILRADIHPMTTFQKVKLTWKCYVPTMLSGAITIGCIIFSVRISAKKIKALAATCTFLAASKNTIEEKIKEVYGEDALKEIRKKANEAYISKVQDNEFSIEDTGQGDTLCFLSQYGRWFWSSPEAVQKAEIDINEVFDGDIYCSMNDFYHFLRIKETRDGLLQGWVNDENFYDPKKGIIFDNYWVDMGKGQPVYVIDILTMPMEGWEDT